MRTIIIDDRINRDKPNLSDEAAYQINQLVEAGILCRCSELPLEQEKCADFLSSYNLIAIHKTYAEDSKLYEFITSFAKRNDKFLIFYSGGITQNVIYENGKRLNIGANDFYTDDLPVFIKKISECDKMQMPLLHLLYGQSWRLSLLLRYRHILWTYNNDICCIDDSDDEEIERELRHLLWNDEEKTLEEINSEIKNEIFIAINK